MHRDVSGAISNAFSRHKENTTEFFPELVSTLEVDNTDVIERREPFAKTSRNLNLIPNDWLDQTIPPEARSSSGFPVSKMLIQGAEMQGFGSPAENSGLMLC